MSIEDAHRFVDELIADPERLLEISGLPEEQRHAAIEALGYSFTSRELDDYVCENYRLIAPKLRLGDGDCRDVVMKNWGNSMKLKK